MGDEKTCVSRRGFIEAVAATTAAAVTFNILHEAHAGNADPIRVGLVGCGQRGAGAAKDCLKSAPNLKLVAMADVFKDKIEAAREDIKSNKQVGAGCAVDDDHCFVGFDGYKQLLKTDCSVVLICTPPFFHPFQLEAAIEANKHVFMEKPACVDAPGVRQIIAAAQKARDKKLNIAVGSQRRHQANYLETIKRLHDGAIGEILSANVWWCEGRHGFEGEKKPEWSDMEYQIRSWYGWRWLSGDHIIEQHVHNLDVVTWVLGKYPIEARGMGSRLRRVVGDCYDNFTVDFVFPDDVHVTSMCRQIPDCWKMIGEFAVGTKGKTNCSNAIWGQTKWNHDGPEAKPYIQEHTDLIAAVRGEAPYLNEAENIAKSTLMGIMGRTSAYTGQKITWDQAMAMQERWGPKELALGDNPVPEPPKPPSDVPV